LDIFSPKDVEVSSPEVYGCVSETFSWKQYGVWKTHGGGNHRPRSSTVKKLVKVIFIIIYHGFYAHLKQLVSS